MFKNCAVCRKRIASHAYYLVCAVCKLHFHKQCLPNVSRCDSIIVNQKGNDWICTHCVKEVFPFKHMDEDSQFYEAVSEFCGSAAAPKLYDLDDRLFVPFHLNDSDYDYDPLFDVDPDEKFF